MEFMVTKNNLSDFLIASMDANVHAYIDEAKRLGIGVDLANATGWPFGGPWVTDDDASKTVYFKTYTLMVART